MLHHSLADRASPSDPAEDARVVAAVLDGDSAAFSSIVDRYHRVLFNVAYRMLGNYEEANDATQDALVKAYEKLSTYDPQYRFFSWIYRILMNECLNVRRARRPVEPLSGILAEKGGVQESLEAAERRRQVQQALLALPIEYREVVVLRYFADLSYEEIGVAVHLPVKTVKSRLHTARRRLAEMLVQV